MTDQNSTAWFDQFTPEILAIEGVRGNEQWCARHWAPCPLLGGNGIKATLLLVEAAINETIDTRAPLCCRLGDQAMYDIWGKCPPEGRIPHGSRY